MKTKEGLAEEKKGMIKIRGKGIQKPDKIGDEEQKTGATGT